MKYLEESFLIEKSKRFDVKGKKYIETPSKYYFVDIGIRNSLINFRQLEKTHIMENIIYTELRIRGFNVDVGIVEKRNNLLAALDISDSTVKSWTSLTDSKIPVTEDLPTICNVLGITLNQLFGIEDDTVVEALLLKKAFDNSEHQGSIKSLLGLK